MFFWAIRMMMMMMMMMMMTLTEHDFYLNLSEERIEEHIWCSFVILKVVCVLTSIVKRRRGRRPPPHKGVPKTKN